MNRKGISYNKAKEIFDNGISQYILSESVNAESFICTELSKYAADLYVENVSKLEQYKRMNEVMEEYFTVKDTNTELVSDIEDIIKGVIKNDD